APVAAGPELHRDRALPDRRRRDVPVRHHQARPVPVAQPPQRLAAGTHPLLAVRHGLHPAAGHPDVLPGRPAVRARPDLSLDHRSEGSGGARAGAGAQRLALDPSYQSTTDPKPRELLVATYHHDLSSPEWSTGYRWDIVL